MNNPNYKCSQSELYTIATIGWQSATQHLPVFSAFREIYDNAFITAKLADIAHAKSMPTIAERNGITAALRVKLANMNRICLKNFRGLKRYISAAYPSELWKIEFNAAGQQDYEDAFRNNWDSTNKILDMVKNYIQNKNAILLANQNMPATFQLKFQNDADNFAATHQEFLDSEELATIGTEDKINMNNKIYADLMAMFADGVYLFQEEDSKRKQFTFSDVLYLASGAGTAGVRGTITDLNTGLPLSDVLVTVVQTNEADTSGEEGKYQISPMAAGTYTLRVIADGYEEKMIPNHEVLTGTISTFNIHLLPAA